MNLPNPQEYKKLYIVEWEQAIYWVFGWDSKISKYKDDTLLGICTETMNIDRYYAFMKLTDEYQHDIIETLLSIKKKEWFYNEFERPKWKDSQDE